MKSSGAGYFSSILRVVAKSEVPYSLREGCANGSAQGTLLAERSRSQQDLTFAG